MPSLATCVATTLAAAILAASPAAARPAAAVQPAIRDPAAPSTDAAPILAALNWGIANSWTGSRDSSKKDAADPSSKNSSAHKKNANQPSCGLSSLKLPQSASPTSTSAPRRKTNTHQATAPLPAPNGTLAYIALGHGTQNYTCASADNATKPVSAGALAALYDMSCPAARFAPAVALLAPLALGMPSPSPSPQSSSSPSSPSASSDDTPTFLGLPLLGHHYFAGTPAAPTFNLATASHDAGYVALASAGKAPAPPGAPRGDDGRGFGAVDWLALAAKDGPQGASFRSVFRVNTAGGNAPGSCAGMPAAFTVPYAAEYWFFR